VAQDGTDEFRQLIQPKTSDSVDSEFTLASKDDAASDAAKIESLMVELEEIRQRLRMVEDETYEEVDLSTPIFDSSVEEPAHVLATRWFERFDVSGFAAFDYLHTGDDGTFPDGGFVGKETTLWSNTQVWDQTSVFYELQVIRIGKDNQKTGQTGELYARFHNPSNTFGVKVGRVDIPFGEEYLSQDSIDNPLISYSAIFPYGFDEGIVFYGNRCGLNWIFSVTEGTDQRSFEDNSEKAYNVKLYGHAQESLYLSGSFMRNGRAAKSGFEFGGSHFQPVGASGASALGASPNSQVDAILYELDARLEFCCDNYLAFSFGQAFVDDANSSFNRDLLWFSAEALHNFSTSSYGVVRYSEIGTYDANAGYHFDGKITAGGNSAFRYDTKRFQRLSLGLGYKPNPRTVIKSKVRWDKFDVINASPTTPGDDNRWLAGLEFVLAI
jgi:hypothetical protein